MEAPRWLRQFPEIEKLLNDFLSRLDKRSASGRYHRLLKKINEKSLPYFFDKSLGNSSDELFQWVEELESLGVLQLTRKRVKQSDPLYLNCDIEFLPEAEVRVRQWLNHHSQNPDDVAWRNAVGKFSDHFPGGVEKLQQRPIILPDTSPTSIVEGFSQIGSFVPETLTLRQLSARCFQGNSKFLDGREALLEELYPGLLSRLVTRPLMVNVAASEAAAGILFIENQDCFHQAFRRIYPETNNLTLVYAQGFKGTAQRLREVTGVEFFFTESSPSTAIARFKQTWFNLMTESPISFWGDLDYSAMQMLKSLRERFPQAQSWKPGYQPMLEALDQGHFGVRAHQKGEQSDPGMTGCRFADEHLLPALRSTGKFLDQEWL